MKLLISVALGGAGGAVLRHLVAGQVTRWAGTGFPVGTLLVNVLGSLLLGALTSLMAHKFNLSAEMRAFLTVGLMGGFTTFSTFSMESVLLIERGSWGLAAGYMIGSIVLGVLAFMGGMWLGKGVL